MALISGHKIVAFVGGVGGAKLALGLKQIVAPSDLTIIVNIGDDFWHYGLRICPDLDTVLYTLSGRVDKTNGWGVEDDSTIVMSALTRLGEEPWFRLGDMDLATHLLRTQLLRDGHTLTQIISRLSHELGIQCAILPATDEEVATRINTIEHGELEFQVYFVKHGWQPTAETIRFEGAETASVTREARSALLQADVILFGPSNPFLSIAPILAVPGMREIIMNLDVPRIAVTPIIQGQAVKGPAAKLMRELGQEVSANSVATFYGKLINGFVYDERDVEITVQGLSKIGLDTIMKTDADKARLAQNILNWAFAMEVI